MILGRSTYPVQRLPVVISIGIQTETGVEEIGFDVSAWTKKWPDVEVEVWHRLPGQADAYLTKSRREGDIVYWQVTDTDTQIPGTGRVELMGTTATRRKLSGSTSTRIRETIAARTKDPPLAPPTWVDTVREMVGEDAIAEAVEDYMEQNPIDAGGVKTVNGIEPDEDGNVTVVEGKNTNASGENAHAEGVNTIASGYASHAEGEGMLEKYKITGNANATTYTLLNYDTGVVVSTYSAGVKGKYIQFGAKVSMITSTVAPYQIRTSETLSSDALSKADVIVFSSASGTNSHVEGTKTVAQGQGAHAEGENTAAQGQAAHAEGWATIASGDCAHAEGSMTTAADGAHAEGSGTVAYGLWSHAEGSGSRAEGEMSHVEGQASAKGKGAHAEGNGEADGEFAHVENEAKATGYGSHAEGVITTASGEGSHSEGYATKASKRSQHVQGEWNVIEEDGDDDTVRGKYAHIVGNGTDKNNRSNAHTLDWDGNAWFAGSVEGTACILKSTTEGSTKRFRLTVDDTGTIKAEEVTA